jgi:hypothetical protein
MDGALYEPSIITGVAVGSTTGAVNLYALASAVLSSATLTGAVTSQNSSNAGTVIDVELSLFETINAVTYTIPLAPTSTQNAATLSLETAPSGGSLTCPTATNCADYALEVSAGSANVGAWSPGGTVLSPNVTLASYQIDGAAEVPSSGGLADCTPAEQTTPAFTLSAGGTTVPVQTLAFTSCQ